jgi:predicted ribosome quality control (RQC) complex YloA/Tae2 family protein
MSLNWKEINMILAELKLEGCRIQKAVQSGFDTLTLRVYGREGEKNLLVCLAPLAVRFHETFQSTPKSTKPLRFAQFLNSRIINGRIKEAVQLEDNRIVRISVALGEEKRLVYIRLWSNAANVIVTDEDGTVLDAMKRRPAKGEKTGGYYAPEKEPPTQGAKKEYTVRELPGDGSFNEKIDALYRQEGGALSLEALREEARRKAEGSIGRLMASLEKLRAKEAEYQDAEKLKEYGDIILANLSKINDESRWLEVENFYAGGEKICIKPEQGKSPSAQAEAYYSRYRKAKSGLAELKDEIRSGEKELAAVKEKLAALLAETNPLVLHKLLKTGDRQSPLLSSEDAKRPGLTYRRGGWTIIVGRDAAENDTLLRRYAKGNDLWLHARDFPGSYVFIKQRAGKTFPLDILLDAGNLAIFYSKGRNNGSGDLFYTKVKYLRRAKDGPKGLVIPTQEKNLHIKVESSRLKRMESCKVEK